MISILSAGRHGNKEKECKDYQQIFNVYLSDGVLTMPVVIIEMWEGRTEEQKEKLMKAVTNAFETIGIKKGRVTVIIHDMPKSNWSVQGEQASKMNL